MVNDENLKPVRTKSEARERGRNGGKKSGESRRRQAELRKAMNLVLTSKIDHEEWTPLLESLGLDSTLEYAVTASMVREAMEGNVSAYRAIMDTVGQTDKSDADLEEQKSKTELNQAKKQSITGENETDEALEKLDQILKGVYDNANEPETE